jgi:hypothetical protein
MYTFICPIYFVQCRQHPGQYEYFNNYDYLEVDYILFAHFLVTCFLLYVMVTLSFLINIRDFMSQIHFRQEHYLCEDEACLARKFIVFATEFELKVISSRIHDAQFCFGCQYVKFSFYVF